MRKLICVFFVVILSSCASVNFETWDTELRTSGYDFRPYTEQGFLFTPEVYTESYDAIGLVEVTYIPKIMEAASRDKSQVKHISGFRVLKVGMRYYYIELPDTDKLISEMFSLADELGADALSNFNITGDTVYNDGVAIETVKVSGFAIKRLSN